MIHLRNPHARQTQNRRWITATPTCPEMVAPVSSKERTLVDYSTRVTDDQLKKQIAARPTTFMLGEPDILPLKGFDSSCSAMAQGATRLARGLAYTKYLNEKFGARHKSVVVPACGHNARCMFTAESVLPFLFPKE